MSFLRANGAAEGLLSTAGDTTLITRHPAKHSASPSFCYSNTGRRVYDTFKIIHSLIDAVNSFKIKRQIKRFPPLNVTCIMLTSKLCDFLGFGEDGWMWPAKVNPIESASSALKLKIPMHQDASTIVLPSNCSPLNCNRNMRCPEIPTVIKYINKIITFYYEVVFCTNYSTEVCEWNTSNNNQTVKSQSETHPCICGLSNIPRMNVDTTSTP